MTRRVLKPEDVSRELVDISTLRPHPDNPNNGDQERINESVSAHGQYRSIVVSSDSVVLAGNHTYAGLLEKGRDRVLVERLPLRHDEPQALEIMAADNKSRDGARYDDGLLASVLQRVQAEQGDLEGTLFREDELAELLARVSGPAEGMGDPDDVPAPPKEPITKPGDLWLLAGHRLLAGDSSSQPDLNRLMAGEKADLLVTDPPYGVSYADKNRFLNALAKGNRIQEPILADHQTTVEMSAFWRATFSVVRRALREGAAYYVTGPQGGDLLLLLLALKDSGFPLRHMLIWAKNNHVLGRSDYHYKHEPIIYGWVEGSHRFYGDHGETSLWEIDKPTSSKLHPTMKPVALFARAIRNSSKAGQVVIDPFAGSGTAAIAAEQESRRACLMELDPAYCDVAARRFQEQTGIQPILEATGEPHDFTAYEPVSSEEYGPALATAVEA